MLKTTALAYMKRGAKIRHRNFAPEEYIKTGTDLDIEFEDGCQCNSQEFWLIRNDISWESGWYIYHEDFDTSLIDIEVQDLSESISGYREKKLNKRAAREYQLRQKRLAKLNKE